MLKLMFAINALYRPSNELLRDNQQFLEFSENILGKLNNYTTAKYKVIASDLNFGNCYCKRPILNAKPFDYNAPDLFSSVGFLQLIDIPIRIPLDSLSPIDLKGEQ